MANENILDDNLKSSDSLETRGKHESSFIFINKTLEELSADINALFSNKGYKLEEGNASSGTYGKGSKIARALLGAFIKRFAFKVKITNDGKRTTLLFSKDGKGYMGGAIGIVQVKNEYESILNLLQDFHTKSNNQ